MIQVAQYLSKKAGSSEDHHFGTLWQAALITVLGFALYGFTTGYWRSPLMGVFVAVKMPLLILLTLGFNSLLNGMLGVLLGSGLGLRGSLHALLSAFAISALILGSLSPVTMFLALSLPPPDSPGASAAHAVYVLSHTLLIALAGLAGLLRLGHLLAGQAASMAAARTTLAAWVLGNAFLGAQFSWVLRPFFGSPHLEIAFLRPDPLRGSFHETLWVMAVSSFEGMSIESGMLLLVLVILVIFTSRLISSKPHRPIESQL